MTPAFARPRGARSVRSARVASAAAGAVAALALSGLMGPAMAAAEAAPRPPAEVAPLGDDYPSQLEQRRRDAREVAVRGVLDGSLAVAPGDTVVELPGRDASLLPPAVGAPATSPYAEIATTGTDRVLTVLVDFGTGDYAGRTWNGPVHGQLPEPDRDRDLVTPRPPSDGAAHYDQLLFGSSAPSLRDYLAAQSGGRYSVDGTVHDWVKVPYNAAYYGVDACDGADCPERVAALAADAMDAFVDDFYARDLTGDLAAYLEPFDQRDPYDADGDGDFDEPDGYVDRVVLVFAGSGQETSGDPDAVRGRYGSMSFENGDDPGAGTRGHPIGSSGLSVDSFVAAPEDIGLGGLVHLYGHALGLPDLADPSASPTVDSNVAFWSPMATGGRLGSADATGNRGLGTTAPDLLAAERMFLGWLDVEVVGPDVDRTVELGTGAALVPVGALTGSTTLAAPADGTRAFAATIGSSADAVLQRPLRGDEGRVSWQQWTDVEPAFDTVRVQALDDGTWRDIAPVSTGRSGWTSRSAPLPDGATMLRFVYSTDAVSSGPGAMLDDIRVGDEPAEGAEDGMPDGWTATGWEAGDGTVPTTAPGFYLAERRAYAKYDAALEVGPYVADPRTGATWVDRFGYEDGVLVTFWDGRAADNVVSAHPGSGRLLVVDARPETVPTISGADAPLGIGPFDATFGTTWTRGFTVDAYALAPGGEIMADRVRVRAQPPVPTFDDTDVRYADGSAGQPRLPGVGVTMTVVDTDAAATTVRFGAPTAPPEPTEPSALLGPLLPLVR